MTTEKLHHIGADLYLPNDFAEYDMPTEYDGLSSLGLRQRRTPSDENRNQKPRRQHQLRHHRASTPK